jgi:alcohol dehydrogenase class IV
MVSSRLINRITEQLAQSAAAVFGDVRPDPSIDILQEGARFFMSLSHRLLLHLVVGHLLMSLKVFLSC